MAKTRVPKKGKIKVKERDIEKALKESKARRRRKTIRLYFLFITLVIVFLVAKFWESSQEREIREIAADLTPTIRVDETSTNLEGDTRVDVIDEGNSCMNHEYILSPGASEILKFEIKLQREVLQLAHLLKNKVENENISLEGSFEKWEEQQVRAEVNSFDLENLTGKANVWLVQAGELLEDYRKAIQASGGDTAGNLDKINGYIAKKIRYTVDFFDDNFGVISTLGRYYYTEIKVGELVESDITDKLGGALVLPYAYEGKRYELPVEKREVEKVLYFLNFEISVNLPQNYNKEVADRESSFVVKIKEVPDIKFVLKLSFDDEDEAFHVFGPAIAADCYKTGEIQ